MGAYIVSSNNDGDDLEQSFNVFSPVLEYDQSNVPQIGDLPVLAVSRMKLIICTVKCL